MDKEQLFFNFLGILFRRTFLTISKLRIFFSLWLWFSRAPAECSCGCSINTTLHNAVQRDTLLPYVSHLGLAVAVAVGQQVLMRGLEAGRDPQQLPLRPGVEED